MEDIVVSVASKAAEYLVAPVGRQCGYVIFTDSYVGQLKEELEKLDDVMVGVQRSVDDAQNNMKEIKHEVNRWKKEAETAANKARGVLDNDVRGKKTCFYGWLPNPKERYCLGRDARKTARAIKLLIPQDKFDEVYYKSAPPGRVAGAPDVNSSAGDGGDTITNSRASTFQGIMKALDDQKLKVIGVYGPGGVGKTTLLEEVKKKLEKEGRPFNKIVKVEVSRTPDLNNIQGQIADALSLNMKDKESPQGRRDHLFRRLQNDPNEKILIILDDLWDKLDLKAVGIPSGDETKNCKLLLTSRDKSVLEQKMLADGTFHLEGLSDDQSFGLFEKTVGDKLKGNEELKAKAYQVVRKLAGLPLLITSVANTLKYSDVSTWDNALIKIEDPNIEKIVKWSYDHLESAEIQSLFLLCGLIGGTIPVELLLVLGMGLGLFEGFNKTIQSSRNRLNAMLDSLHSICLLQDGGDDKGTVTLHDLYSEVVVTTPFGGQNSLMINSYYGPWPKEKLEKCWVCLVNVGSDRLAELMPSRFPNSNILIMSEQHDMEDCNILDFTYMKELRVLYIRFMSFTSIPSSIEILGKLQSLYLDNCNVEDVAILGKLKALQILSFAGSNIYRLPKEIGELTNLRSLILRGCYRLRTIEPGVLKGLINLEELHMQGSFDQWMGEDEIPSESCNARLAELKSLTKLTSLEISIGDPTILSEDDDLSIGNLIKFRINIGDVDSREFNGLRTMELNLEDYDSILSKEWVQEILQKTEYLYLEGLGEFKNRLRELKTAQELCMQGFQQLRHLNIQNSPSIMYIASSFKGAFTILESLFLKNLINLEKICHGLIAPESFSKLKVVSVRKCNQLKYLWCLSHMQRLVQLEEIEVQECDSMQAIVTNDAVKDIVTACNKVELPNVRRLELANLPNMTSFCTGAGITIEGAPIKVSFPRLESLVMVGLLDLEKILYCQPPLEYSNLKSIKIRGSKSRLSFLKLDWILKLPNLESMKIESSPSAEVVFDLEQLKVTGHVEILSRLMKLTLRELPNLQCMWRQDVQLQETSVFRNLKKLKVSNTGLAFLFPLSVAKCLREIRDIQVMDCPNMKAVIVDEEGRDEGTDGIIEFPLLKRLRISSCPTKNFLSCPSGKKESETTTSGSQYVYSDSFFNRKVSLPSLEELELASVGSFKRISCGKLPISSLCELATLTLENCSELLNVFHSTIIERLRNLKSITINECPSMESLFGCGSLDSNTDQTRVLPSDLASVYVESCPSPESLFDCGSFDSNTEQRIVLLPKLKEVWLRGAGRLRYVAKSDSRTVLGFPSLETICVENCSNLRYLFPYFTATTLKNLNMLEIISCEQMKEVISKKEGCPSEAEVMSFPGLSELSLLELDNLISFSSGSCSYDFASLEDLRIVGCRDFGAFIASPTSVKRPLGQTAKEDDKSPQPLFNEMVMFPNLKSLRIEGARCKELWNNQIPINSFCKLESLKLKHCDNLLCISPSHMWKRLQCCLHYLKVKSCHLIEFIYESDGTVTKNGKLRRMVLHDLKNLRHIWQYDGLPNGGEFRDASLEDLRIVGCRNFGAFISSPTSVKRPLGQMAKEDDESPQSLFNEMVTFTNLKSLKIEGSRCKELWNNQIPINSFCKLESLELEHCDNLLHIAPSNMWKRLQCCLKILQVKSCHSIEIIYNSDEMDTESSKLERLVLRDLDNLRLIWQSEGLPNVPFPNLRDIEATRCSRLEILFATFTAKLLGQIEELVVESCEDMKLIAGHEKCEEATGTTITFSKLTVLRLSELPKFRSFLPEKYSPEFPSLQVSSWVSCGTEPDQCRGDWEICQRHRENKFLPYYSREPSCTIC